ncbi:hypothetical protein WJX72_007523 [[Myrmecia] bisecta]|uniref:Uncharacterized protein n=1 Tax=[Myrmecia] bisecta TaxID=41462 RepID=A0AAW1P994_9CHLO
MDPNAATLPVAVRGIVRLIGNGVTPFNPTKQSTLIMAVASVMTTVGAERIRVVLVADAYKLRRRELLATALKNVADVTLEINAGNVAHVPAVQTELKGLFDGQLATALQKQGESQWSISLLSTEAGTPSSNVFPYICKSSLGKICLDGSGLSASGAKAIIAVGCILVVGVAALVWLLFDIRNRSGKSGECEYATSDSAQSTPQKGETPTSGRAVPVYAQPAHFTAGAGTTTMKGSRF